MSKEQQKASELTPETVIKECLTTAADDKVQKEAI